MIKSILIRTSIFNMIIIFALLGMYEVNLLSIENLVIALVMIGLIYSTFMYKLLSKENSAGEEGN